MDSFIQAAARYLDLGWAVVPLNPGQKWLSEDLALELKVDWERPPQQALGWSTNLKAVEAWFDRKPDLNLGIRMRESQLTVVDIDALGRWQRFSETLALPVVPTVRTPRGLHYYFRTTPGEVTGAIYVDGDYVGDFLTGQQPPWRPEEYAYVVAPPSVLDRHALPPLDLETPYTHVYRWVIPPAQAVPLQRVPGWLRDLVRELREPRASWYYNTPDNVNYNMPDDDWGDE